MQFRQAQGTDKDQLPWTQAAAVLAVPGCKVCCSARRGVQGLACVLHDKAAEPAEENAVTYRNCMQDFTDRLHNSANRKTV